MLKIKIKNLAFITIIGVALTGLLALAFVLADNKKAASELNGQSQTLTKESYTAATVSKGTILLLLAVGVIGFLGLSRKKTKNKGGFAQNNGLKEVTDQQDLKKDP